MKNLVCVLFTSIMTLSVSSFAQPQDLKKFPVTSGVLNFAQFGEEFQSGELTIDYATKTVSLLINDSGPVIMPIEEMRIGACGATLILARQKNGSTVDEISIKDNTTITCRILLPSKGTATVRTYLTTPKGTETFESSLILEGRKSND